MNKLPATTIILVATLFAVAGCALGLVDPGDYVPVPPTDAPAGMVVEVPTASQSVNEAKRDLEVVVDATTRYVEWRSEDIQKRERWIAFAEGFVTAGLEPLMGEAAKFAGPFAPLVTLLGGYMIKRRKDRDPDEVRQEKEASYNAGQKAMLEALKAAGVKVPGEASGS